MQDAERLQNFQAKVIELLDALLQSAETIARDAAYHCTFVGGGVFYMLPDQNCDGFEIRSVFLVFKS